MKFKVGCLFCFVFIFCVVYMLVSYLFDNIVFFKIVCAKTFLICFGWLKPSIFLDYSLYRSNSYKIQINHGLSTSRKGCSIQKGNHSNWYRLVESTSSLKYSIHWISNLFFFCVSLQRLILEVQGNLYYSLFNAFNDVFGYCLFYSNFIIELAYLSYQSVYSHRNKFRCMFQAGLE